jgi:FAD:protein FMN transferase
MISSCGSDSPKDSPTYIVVEGQTMGTYYRVTYADSLNRDFSVEMDQLLKDINLEISTYIDSSTISRFNQAEESLDLGIRVSEDAPASGNRHFWACYWKGLEIYQKSGGAFDPTVMPLVNYWGFGYTEQRAVTQVDSAAVDSLRQFVGMNKVTLEKGEQTILRKSVPGVQLDFGALGQGYGVDAIAEFLDGREVKHYLVDIGGEQRSKGKSTRGGVWRIGISLPQEGAEKEEIVTSFPLDNMSINTSGNYRNYYQTEGAKYGHTINPATGYPERNALLSATVFAKECLHADVLATTCMVLGPEKAMDFIRRQAGTEAFFIIGNEDGSMRTAYTDGLKKYFK